MGTKTFETPPWVKNQEKILDDMLKRGVSLVQRREDGVYVRKHPEGTEEILPLKDSPLGERRERHPSK